MPKALRALLCYLGLALSIALALLGTAGIVAAYSARALSSMPALDMYLLNAFSEVFLFLVPALLILLARRERVARLRGMLGGVDINIVGFGALGAVSCAVVASVAAALWSMWLERAFGYQPAAQSLPVPENAGQWALAVFAVSLVPAVAEETLFRALVQGTWLRRWPRAGVWVTAAVFAAAHLEWAALPALLMVGLILCLLLRRRGLLAAMLFHALYNAAVLVLSTLNAGITMIAILLSVLAFIIAMRALLKKEDTHALDGTGV